MSQERPTITFRPRGWVLLGFSGITLAIRQNEVRQIVPSASLSIADPDRPEVGWLVQGDESWPAFALDEELWPILKDDQRFAVFVEALHRPIGLLADSVRVLPEEEALKIQPLPACMRLPGAPLTGLALLEGSDVVLVSDAMGIDCRLRADSLSEIL